MWSARRRQRHNENQPSTATVDHPSHGLAERKNVTEEDSAVGIAKSVREVLEWLSLIVPTLTLLTALLFWFGWTFTNTRAAYFGIDYTTLGFSTSDYVLRSAEGIFVPATVTLLVVLAALSIHAAVSSVLRFARGRTVVRTAAWIVVVVGLAATVVGVWAMFAPLPVASYYLLAPVLQGGGIVAVAYGVYVLRSPAAAARVGPAPWERYGYWVVAMLVILNLFWVFSLYASALGVGRAQELELNLATRPSVTVFSTHSLAFGNPVVSTRLDDPDSLYRFSYTGLRLLIRSDDKYFLLSEGWSRQTGVAIVLVDGPDIRLEFEPGGVRP